MHDVTQDGRSVVTGAGGCRGRILKALEEEMAGRALAGLCDVEETLRTVELTYSSWDVLLPRELSLSITHLLLSC